MRVIDFFCGAGGFSEGFRQAGFEIIFAVDNWLPAVTTFRANKPNVNVLLDDVLRISRLDDDEFERIVPDSEVIIGSPPCVAFSHSNKSGNGDKSLGIKLIEAFFRIVARKKYKQDSKLKYWILENVPKAANHIKESYSPEDLDLTGNFVFRPKDGATGVYNAKNFGAPTNRKRFLCGEFPIPVQTHGADNELTLRSVLESLDKESKYISDINYPGFSLLRDDITDHHYINKVASFEWEKAKRLKQDKGYMGRMSFPENLDKPARTVMATMSTSSRESMILGDSNGNYRLPTIRESASIMSYPIDYKFYGKSKGIKHTLVGNSVPPKLSYAIAKAILTNNNLAVNNNYLPIKHDPSIDFINLNNMFFPTKTEKPRRDIAKFKYHIPYLIFSSYRVELTNYNSNFKEKKFQWDVEIHFSQGKKKANKFTPSISLEILESVYRDAIFRFVDDARDKIVSHNRFQERYCMTSEARGALQIWGPYELLDKIKDMIDKTITKSDQGFMMNTGTSPEKLPLATILGYLTLRQIILKMGEIE